jgi:hypothetical protein
MPEPGTHDCLLTEWVRAEARNFDVVFPEADVEILKRGPERWGALGPLQRWSAVSL